MCQVSPVREVQTKEFITGLQTSQEHSGICLCTGMRLDISPFSTEQLLQPVNSQLLTHIHHLTSSIIASSG
jgi:hypothetical protein